LPPEPITLSPEQIDELNRKLTDLRHDVNNQLSLMFAAIELIRRQPANADRLVRSLAEQPPRITQVVTEFLDGIEAVVRARRP